MSIEKFSKSTDVTRVNPFEFLYLKGNESTNGSLRLKPDATGIKFEFQIRTAGTWNDTDIQVASASIFLGRDLTISSAGEWIETDSINVNQKSLIPHVNFDDDGTDIPHSPVLGQKIVKFPIQTDESSEITGTDLQEVTINPADLLASKIYYKTGSIGATEPIQLTFRRGVDTSAPIFWQRNLPTALMATPDTEFIIELLGEISGQTGEPIHTQFLSTAPISLKSDSGGAFFAFADFQPLAVEDILLDNMIISNELDLVFQNNGGLVINDLFRG